MLTRKKGGKKERKGPTESATKFSVGTRKIGNDGNTWIIISTSSGKHRWKKVAKTKKTSKISNIKTKTISKKSGDVSLKTLEELKKKYKVSTHGSKKNIALGLWRVSGHTMNNHDLKLISYLLPRKEVKKIEKKIKVRTENSITNYRGMWKPIPKPLTKMSRNELITNIRSFRNAWEKITTRNQDLSDERLANETTEQLRNLLKFYYSNDAKLIAEDWLRK